MPVLSPDHPTEAVLPAGLGPMLAVGGEGPLDSTDYAYEVKWDGMRVLIGIDGDAVTMRTRNGLEAVDRFPELGVLRQFTLPRRAVLDGEIVCLVDGIPNFGALQHRIHASNPHDIKRLMVTHPVSLILFDMVRCEDEWLLDQPWEERRRRLDASIAPGPVIQLSLVCPDGRALWESVCAMGLEGVMAKSRKSLYEPGRRSPGWLKIKCVQTVDVVVGGWTEGTGARSTGLGALIVGAHDADGKLVPLGRVGSGFDQDGLKEAIHALRALEIPTCPFKSLPDANTKPHWIRPDLVCEVRYQGWSADGKLRFPVFLRWRADRHASDVFVEA